MLAPMTIIGIRSRAFLFELYSYVLGSASLLQLLPFKAWPLPSMYDAPPTVLLGSSHLRLLSFVLLNVRVTVMFLLLSLLYIFSVLLIFPRRCIY